MTLTIIAIAAAWGAGALTVSGLCVMAARGDSALQSGTDPLPAN